MPSLGRHRAETPTWRAEEYGRDVEGGRVRRAAPVLDTTERVVGYELLHRVSATNRYDGTDAAAATGQLLSDHLLTDTWDRLTGGRRAWVNFPAALLVSGAALLVPPDRMVVELLDDIAVDDDIVNACRHLVDCGYTLAADDVVDADDPNLRSIWSTS